MNIMLSPNELSMVKAILINHLSPAAEVYVFGSRARGDAKPFSDLDLAIDDQGKPFPLSIQAAIAYDFEESDLPFKVDIVDLNSIRDSFKKHIAHDLVRLL